MLQEADESRVIVQTRHLHEVTATSSKERVAPVDRNFFERFQAIAHERRGEHEQASNAGLRQARQLGVSVWLHPSFTG
jgi:hypothetical protein